MKKEEMAQGGSSSKRKKAPLYYEGIPYQTVQKISKKAEVDYRKLMKLIKMGIPPDEAVKKIKTEKKYFYNGKWYATKREIAEDLGISVRSFEQNKKYREIVESVAPVHNPFIFRGVSYESKFAFYKKLGVSGSAVRKYAIRHGISTEEALEQIADKKLGGTEE